MVWGNFLFLSITLFSFSSSATRSDTIQTRCPNKDEVVYTCKPDCKNTCTNYKNPNAVCSAVCVSGCFCRPGLVKRESDGQCVNPEVCAYAPCTSETEVEYLCKPDCENTCHNYNNKTALCPVACQRGCFCKPGYVKRERDDRCVLPHQCNHDPCPNENETEYFCKPFCKNTCRNYKNPDAVCPALCSPGCFCKPGLVKRERDGKCVRPEQCGEVQCPLNEKFSECVVPCNDCKTKGRCKFLSCQKGCDCVKGYYRIHTGKCVPHDQCPVRVKCPIDEEFYSCIPTCNHTCINYGRNSKCPEFCSSGCFCRKGLILNARGKCVTPGECRNDLCRSEEEYYDCAPICDTCINYNRSNVACRLICKTGCFCKRGLLLRQDGKCVIPEQCPKRAQPVKYPSVQPRSLGGGSNPADVWYQIRDGKSRHRYYPETFYRPKDTESSTVKTPVSHQAPESAPTRKEDSPKSADHLPKTYLCRSDEEYYDCAPICDTCINYNRSNVACSLICKTGCFCKRGLLLREDGKCVKPEQCPSQRTYPPIITGAHPAKYPTVYPHSLDGSSNPADVRYPIRGEKFQPQYYPENFHRPKDTEPSTVKIPVSQEAPESVPTGEEDSPKSSDHLPKTYACRKNEIFYKCVPLCQVCENYNKTDVYCPPICQEGCFCQSGFLMRKDGLCVLPEECNPGFLENVHPLPPEDVEDPYDPAYYDSPSYYSPEEFSE